ncbi:MAG: tetratricopeptide repeat protein [Treponema sp.]|nr:tetratricopeptide repeat protein [Treponema sp.]
MFVVVSLCSALTVGIVNIAKKDKPDKNDLLQLWADRSFDEVYTLSGEQLVQKPLDYFLLTIHGFAAFQIAIAQIDNFSMLSYIDNCIWSLRKAFLSEGKTDGRLLYVLGKAYFYKGTSYSDLAVKYLQQALDSGYTETDIPEYLGMAYINIKDYRSSVAAFSQALNSSAPSDTLLLSIAGSYTALGDDDSAYAYLTRCVDVSKDSTTIFAARLSMGDILLKKGDFDGAEEQYTMVINDSGGNAEAYYRLGELYNQRGETVKARAEWRRAVQIDPANANARARLNLQ